MLGSDTWILPVGMLRGLLEEVKRRRWGMRARRGEAEAGQG